MLREKLAEDIKLLSQKMLSTNRYGDPVSVLASIYGKDSQISEEQIMGMVDDFIANHMDGAVDRYKARRQGEISSRQNVGSAVGSGLGALIGGAATHMGYINPKYIPQAAIIPALMLGGAAAGNWLGKKYDSYVDPGFGDVVLARDIETEEDMATLRKLLGR